MLIAETMTLIKAIRNENMLLPFEQLHIQSLDQTGKLISQQYHHELNLLFQLAFSHPPPPHTQQNRASKAAARKPDTQPSTPHCTDNFKTKV
jgi:hypothetical protein